MFYTTDMAYTVEMVYAVDMFLYWDEGDEGDEGDKADEGDEGDEGQGPTGRGFLLRDGTGRVIAKKFGYRDG